MSDRLAVHFPQSNGQVDFPISENGKSDTLTLHFPQSNRQVDLCLEGEEKIIAGVSDDSDLNLIDYFYGPIGTISRQHFEIYKTNNDIVIKDLESTNGTEVNNQRLWSGGARLLSNGDVIKLAENDNFIIQIGPPDTEKTNGDISKPAPKMPDKLGIGFDENESRFIVDGNVIPEAHLSELEDKLLGYLYQNAGKRCSSRQIAQGVWGGVVSDGTIHRLIYRLRRKLNEISPGSGIRYLKTSRGYLPGYVLMLK